jgi:hypothetical protein
LAPKTFQRVVISLVLTIAALAVWNARGQSQPGPADPGFDHSASGLARAAQASHVHPPDHGPPGTYPAAPSTAVGMTPAWRSFADTVDRICALSFNYAMVAQARTERLAELHGWSNPAAEAAVVRDWAQEDLRIHKATAQIGTPPAQPVLFQAWRANVARRTGMFFQAARVASTGDFTQERRIINRMTRIKQQSDKLGQRFGLRICTSN